MHSLRPTHTPTNRRAAAVCLAAVLLAVAATVASWAMVHSWWTAEEINRLRELNGDLMTAKEALESRLWDLQTQLTEYEHRTQELAVVAGVELGDDDFAQGLGGQEPVSIAPDEHLNVLSQRSRRLSTVLDDVETRLAGTPSVFPAAGELTSRFGYRKDPLTGDRSFHRGIDIGTDPGHAVVASADGLVALAGRKGALGNTVHLSHGFGLKTRYGHLSKIVVEAGQTVSRGDIVGYVGRTGRATGFHLHFEVLQDGRPVDPLRFVKVGAEGP